MSTFQVSACNSCERVLAVGEKANSQSVAIHLIDSHPDEFSGIYLGLIDMETAAPWVVAGIRMLTTPDEA